MRTLFVTNDFPPRRGGIEQYVRTQCGLLPPEDVVVYTSSEPGDAAYDAQQPFTVHRDRATMLLPTPRVAGAVREVLRAEGCERVVFGAAAPLGLLAPTLRAAGVTEIVAHTHGHEAWWAKVPLTRQLLRRIGDQVDDLTYVSGWCRDAIAPALSQTGRQRLRHLPPTIDEDRFRAGAGVQVRRQLGIPDDALVVLCVGRLVRRKGQDTLVRLWPELLRRHPGTHLVLVGDGPDRRRIERMVARRGVASSVHLVGAVDPDLVPPYYAAADVFAMPTRSRWLGLEAEAFGIVHLEAVAAGLTVAGTGTAPGPREAAGRG